MSHYTGSPGLVVNTIHSLFGLLDGVIYNLIVQIYKLFFAVSTSTIIDGSVARAFYQRVQLILGIFMIFKLAMSLLNLIINPDSIKDKNTGTGKILVRVIITLLMLTAIVPLNIPGAEPRTLNGYINDHGILFGALYAVQDRILSENVIAKLLLGYQTVEATDSSEVPDTSLGTSFEGMGQLLSTTILKSFVLVNVKDDTIASNDPCNGDTNCPNAYCPAELRDSGYGEEGATVDTITKVVNLKCGDHYAFHYMMGGSTVVGIITLILLLGYTIDVAIRAIKLVILRVIAPIPIISYVDPKASKDGAFASWVKALISTYLDLFVRLAIIYFGIFIIATIIQSGPSGIRFADGASGLLKAMTLVFLILGILFFMKQAPNFIKSMLGSKNPSNNVGLSGILGGVGTLAAGGGVAAAISSGWDASSQASEAIGQGKNAPGAFNTYRDKTLQQLTGDKNARGGIGGMLNRWGGRHMAAKYGVTPTAISQNKKLIAAEKQRLSGLQYQENMLKEKYDGLSKALDTNATNIQTNEAAMQANEAAMVNDRNAYASYIQGSIASRYVNEDGSYKNEEAYNIFNKKYHKEFQEFENKTRDYRQEQIRKENLQTQLAARASQLRTERDQIEAQRGLVSEQREGINVDIYNSNDRIEQLGKNLDDAKSFQSTTTERPKAYTKRNPYTPDIDRSSNATDRDFWRDQIM